MAKNEPVPDAIDLLFEAVKSGSAVQVAHLINDFSWQTFVNLTPTLLHQSTGGNHSEVLELLLDIGAKVDCCNAQQMTPLHVACSKGHGESVDVLLSRKADVNALDFDSRTPLYFASYDGHTDCVEKLLTNPWQKAFVNLPRHGGWTPLHETARFGFVSCLELLLRFGADVSTKTDDAWWTPGHMAVSNGRLECLKVLIDYGIDVNAKAGPDHLSTLLHEASNGGHSDCVEALLLVGADALATDGRGELALHLAARQGHERVVEILVQHYKSIGRADLIDAIPLEMPRQNQFVVNTALHLASMYGHERCLEVLLKHGASHLLNGMNLYPCMVAAKKQHVPCLRIMLAHDTEGLIKQADPNGFNALHYLCVNAYSVTAKTVAMACLLINSGIDLEASPEDDVITPLYMAVRNGAQELVQFLLVSGADPYIDLHLSDNMLKTPKVRDSNWIFRNARTEPKSLLLCCRIALRKAIQKQGRIKLTDVHQLPLPKALQYFIFHGHRPTDGMCDLINGNS